MKPSTTSICAGLCLIFNACQVCIETGRTALPDSLWDVLAVGFVGCVLTPSEGSAWTVGCRGAIMSQQRPFSVQNKWSQTRRAPKPHTCNYVKHFHQSEVNVGRMHWFYALVSQTIQYGSFTCDGHSRWRSATNSYIRLSIYWFC